MIDLEWLTTQVAGLVRETGVFIAAELGKVANDQIETKDKNSLVSYVDKTAEAHDFKYALANNNQDIRTADLKMVQSLKKARANKLDSNFNINQAELIRLKILLENV